MIKVVYEITHDPLWNNNNKDFKWNYIIPIQALTFFRPFLLLPPATVALVTLLISDSLLGRQWFCSSILYHSSLSCIVGQDIVIGFVDEWVWFVLIVISSEPEEKERV